ncbi:MAG TPA: DUF1622 domain-containing protein [Gammaproteobacteria bacterium]
MEHTGQFALLPAPHQQWVENTIINAVEWLRLSVETIGALVIALGVIIATLGFLRELRRGTGRDFNSVRLTLARYLALALEFQLGADILSTAIAPGWDQIGKLGAIAIIRTALNYFLMREMAVERQQLDEVNLSARDDAAARAKNPP